MRGKFNQWLAAVLAKQATSAMAKAHGGKWRLTIDHECGFILIQQPLSRPVRASALDRDDISSIQPLEQPIAA